MQMSLHDVLNVNLRAFDHMMEELGKSYADFVLRSNDQKFRLNLAYLLSDAFEPKAVLDGGGRPYDAETAREVLVATALDVPLSSLEEVKVSHRNEFFVRAWKDLRNNYWSQNWYSRETFALRMRPMLEGSRKSLEGYWLERSVRESLARVSANLGIKIEGKGDKPRKFKNRNVITLQTSRSTIKVQVKGVNSPRHHSERAKILAKFSEDVAKEGDIALPILVGISTETYQDIPALRYIRMDPKVVIEMGDTLDPILTELVCRLM